ncbi:hypothetical protein CASFOL_019562 [Castilleja foliolosa]|uniref:EGF-like domain-containing protein n=1 Tax=Castilleja foliolosa TaxID=1961234 RepID=A0ABD3D5C3_9LAMI
MFSFLKWKLTWSVAASIASILALISVIHLFLYPVVPSLDYLSLRQAQSSCIPINGTKDNPKQNPRPMVDLKVQYPDDLHNAVTYNGAPWKAEIGRWLSGCNSNTTAIEISEKIGGKSCKNDCSGQGICNRDLGQCRCFHGFGGDGCSERLQLKCNYPKLENQPYGPWVVSICAASCDTSRAMCFCGEGGPPVVDWAVADRDIFTTNGSVRGWCNVDPAEAYESKVAFKEECDCKYDGLSGRFCETPVQSVCINQCSGQGYCRGGFCQCENGWYGVDCSVPSFLSSIGQWPKWLQPAKISFSDSGRPTRNLVNLKAIVQKKRPLIYVYDLPAEFNSLLLEGRHYMLECVNRIYDDMNATIWTDQLYGAQMAIYESLLASPHRTLNGDEADYFFVPALDSCIITRADDAPHFNMKDHRGLRSSLTLELYKEAYEHIMQQYSYWNQSSGKDHIWPPLRSACYAPKEIWNSMMLVHWGNTNSKHNHSTTAYWGDIWDTISSDRRGNHTCFNPEKDLVLPAWKQPNERSLNAKLWARPLEQRRTLFYFNGNLGPAYENGRPEATYSMGIRQKVAEEFGSSPDKKGKLGKQHVDDVVVTPLRSDNYHEEIANSVFCGVMPGDGWSGRMEDSILQGCVPVVIQDGIYLPYENVLNYESFAVRIREDEIPNLINILRSINKTEVEFKLANVKKVWHRFLYRDSVLLEAYRQNATAGVRDWAVKFAEIDGDDVFNTLVQVLHYKLHNDPWRREFVSLKKKDFGLPIQCLINNDHS